MEEFFKQQAGWLNAWQEQQKKLTQQYAKWGEEFAQGVAGVSRQQVPTNFEDLLKTQQELFEQFAGFATELQQKTQQLYSDKLPGELLRMFNFSVLQEFYKSWLGNLKFPGGLQNPFLSGQSWADPSSFLNSFMNQQNPFFSAFAGRNLPNDLQQLFGLLQGGALGGGDLYSQIFTTYQGFFNQLSGTVTSQGFDKLIEAFTRWKEQADPYLLAPQFGVNREIVQKFSTAISLSLDYLHAVAIMARLMEKSVRKSGNRFQAKLVERSLNNEPPIAFSDFCSLWTSENEAVFLEVFKSEEYAKTQRQLTSAGLRLKLQITGLVEKALSQTPIALTRDVDLAAKEIIQLKRDLRQAAKQGKLLAAEVGAARAAAAASEQRAQDLAATLANFQQEALTQNQRLETSLSKAQGASQDRLKALEEALAKLQTQAKAADQTAKTAGAQPAKPAAASNKTSPATPKKAAPARAKKAATTAPKTAAPRRTKKPAGTPTE